MHTDQKIVSYFIERSGCLAAWLGAQISPAGAGLYRRFVICEPRKSPIRSGAKQTCRMPFGDTADWKSALRAVAAVKTPAPPRRRCRAISVSRGSHPIKLPERSGWQWNLNGDGSVRAGIVGVGHYGLPARRNEIGGGLDRINLVRHAVPRQ